MRRATATQERSGWLARLLRRDKAAEGEEPNVRARLSALAGPEGIALLNSLYSRLERLEDGVDRERFLVAHKDKREQIQRLSQWFVKETSDARRAYRPTLMALPLVDDEQAQSRLELIDQVLRYFSEELENREVERPVTIAELTSAFGAPEQHVAEALAYLFEGPLSAGRSSGYPASPNWNVTPNLQSLDYPNINALLRQMTEWAERSANPSPLILHDDLVAGDPDVARRVLTDKVRDKGVKAWVKKHKLTSAIVGAVAMLGGAAAFLDDITTIASFLTSLFGAG